MAQRKAPSFANVNSCSFLILLIFFQIANIRAEPIEESSGTISFKSGRQIFQDISLNETSTNNTTPNNTSANSTTINSTNATVSVNATNGPAPAPPLTPLIAPSPGTEMVPQIHPSCGVGGPCLNGGEPTLIEKHGNVSCVCNCTFAVGFDGDHCEIPRQYCDGFGSFYCANGGQCAVPSFSGGPFTCHCPIGFYGLQCTEKGIVCTPSLICKHGGACNATAEGKPECKCPPGYGGEDCGKDVAATPAGGAPVSLFSREGRKANPLGVAFGVIGALLLVGLLAVGGVYCWRRVKKRRSPYSFDYLYQQQSAPMTGGAFSEVQMEDMGREYRNGSNIHNTSLG